MYTFNSVYSDRSDLDLSDEMIRIKNSFSVESYDEKTAENYRNCYVVEKCIISKLPKISSLNSNSSKTFKEFGKNEINLYDHLRTSWII